MCSCRRMIPCHEGQSWEPTERQRDKAHEPATGFLDEHGWCEVERAVGSSVRLSDRGDV
jgi:hypothetical protein